MDMNSSRRFHIEPFFANLCTWHNLPGRRVSSVLRLDLGFRGFRPDELLHFAAVEPVEAVGERAEFRDDHEESVGKDYEKDERPEFRHDVVRPEETLVPELAVAGDLGEVGEPLFGVGRYHEDVPYDI